MMIFSWQKKIFWQENSFLKIIIIPTKATAKATAGTKAKAKAKPGVSALALALASASAPASAPVSALALDWKKIIIISRKNYFWRKIILLPRKNHHPGKDFLLKKGGRGRGSGRQALGPPREKHLCFMNR